jgi:hypothetical protein
VKIIEEIGPIIVDSKLAAEEGVPTIIMPEKYPLIQGPSEYDCFCGAKNPSEHIWVDHPGERTYCQSFNTFGKWSYKVCIDKPPENFCTEEDMKDIST